MSVEIDYPLPGATVSPLFAVGGTYDKTGKKAVARVRVTFYQSDGTTAITNGETLDLNADTGSWLISLFIETPPVADGVLKAVLLVDGGDLGTDEVDDVDVQVGAGGWILITPVP